MFHSISWQAYWTTIAIFAAGYYLILYFLYFRNKIGPFLQRNLVHHSSGGNSSTQEPAFNSVSNQPNQSSLFGADDPSEFTLPAEDTEERIVYTCMDEITAFFEEAKRTKWVKTEIMMALHTILKKYPSLNSSEYKHSISNVLVSECEHLCSIHLSAEDLVGVWIG